LSTKESLSLDTKSNHLITLQKNENIYSFLMSQTKGVQLNLVKKYPTPVTVASTLIPVYDFLDLLENIDFKSFSKHKNK